MTRVLRAGIAVGVVVLLTAGLTSCGLVPTPLGNTVVYAASPSGPGALLATADGSVWFVNRGNYTIGRRSPSGRIDTFFAPGADRASSLTVGPDGDIWFTQDGDRLGRVTADGEVTTYPAGFPGAADITTGPDGNLWYVGQYFTSPGYIAKRTPAGVVKVNAVTGVPRAIVSGPDGNLWFTTTSRDDFNRTIVRFTPQGVSTVFTTPGLDPGDITAGPDGNLWFANGDSIGRITTSGVITLFHDPAVIAPTHITVGPDGNLWFVGGDAAVGRVTTAGVATRFPDPAIVEGGGIAVASDGLWFTNATSPVSGTIGHVTMGGLIELTEPGAIDPRAIAKGSDGSIWFTNYAYDPGDGIARIAPDGTTQFFHSRGVHGPGGIATGVDGSTWFTSTFDNTIGRVTSTGSFTYFTDPSVQGPYGITRGSDGNMWFANHDGLSIGRITPGGTITAYSVGLYTPDDITTASDGGMWFHSTGSPIVGRMDTTGASKKFTLPYRATAVSAIGPDVWFTVADQDLIGKVTPGGVVTTYTDPLIDNPHALAGDGAGNVYFGNGNYSFDGFGTGGSIGRRTPDGKVTVYPSSTTPFDMVGGPGDIWFTTGPADSVIRFGTRT